MITNSIYTYRVNEYCKDCKWFNWWTSGGGDIEDILEARKLPSDVIYICEIDSQYRYTNEDGTLMSAILLINQFTIRRCKLLGQRDVA